MSDEQLPPAPRRYVSPWPAETPEIPYRLENPTDADAWGQPLTAQREQELHDLLNAWNAPNANHGERRGPFDGVWLTGADVFFLAAYTLAGLESSREGIEQAAARLRDPDPDMQNRLDLFMLHLEGANLRDATLRGANLRRARLSGTVLTGADLIGATLSGANLFGAILHDAALRGADLSDANLSFATLSRATLTRATLDGKTRLDGTILATPRSWRDRLLDWRRRSQRNTSAVLGDIHWGGVGTVDLTAVQWGPVQRLGDERGVGWRAGITTHEAVARAYRQLAAQLRAQGVSEVADRFALRAQVRQRGVLLRRCLRNPFRLPQYLGSWLLAILAGYGYRPGRTIFWYLVVIASFTRGYLQVTHGASLFGLFEPPGTKPLLWYEALVLSVASFHGRGFFPQGLNLGDPVAILAATEAVLGLFIEISFIATFTQRLFGAR